MYTHRLGQLTLTVLSDGPIELPAGDEFYVGDAHDCDVIAELNSGPAHFSQNPLIIDSPDSGRTLIDAGVGSHPHLNSTRFGPNAGQFAHNLVRAGIDPHTIDRVLITHLHPDHSWGITNADGTALFPNATVHLHAAELAHWTELRDITLHTPVVEANRRLGAYYVLRAYQDRISTFDQRTQIASDITALPLTGHTPGHSGYQVRSAAATLISWGDTCHNEAQVQHPTVGARTDVDASARSHRQQLLSELANTPTLVHAYHLPFPGIGTITSHGDGFSWNSLPALSTPLSGGTA